MVLAEVLGRLEVRGDRRCRKDGGRWGFSDEGKSI